ncbi:MAG: hypothetical protein IPL61_26010 [Myxococcales bacterium]|nr:hypothetical protein [Myxococcales bacterium]
MALARPAPHLRQALRAGLGVRVVALCSALALLLAGGLELYHQATTRHVRCAEHGELVDRHQSASAALTVDDHAADGVGVRGRPGPADAGPGHSHCGLACAAPTQTVSPRRVAVTTRPTTATIVALDGNARVTLGRGVYRSAPKTSPPA